MSAKTIGVIMLAHRIWGTGLLVLLLMGTLTAAGASGPWVVVNSQDYADVISGSVYAAQTNASYMFVLTPSHGEYLAHFFANSTDSIQYYESAKPVSTTLGAKLPKANLQTHKSDTLWPAFASMSPARSAILLSTTDGAEAVSAAPYAAVSGAGLYFADASTASAQLAKLESEGYTILIYGSIADSLGAQQKAGLDVVRGASIMADNLVLLNRFAAIRPVHNVIFASGLTFEKSMVLSGMPVALLGRTEVPPATGAWMQAHHVRTGMVVQGEADIDGAVRSLQSDYGLSLFAILGEGYAGDAVVKPAALMPLPGPNAIARVESVRYDSSRHQFDMMVSNIGNAPLYVRAAVSVPGGMASSSVQQTVPAGGRMTLVIPLDAGSLVSGYVDRADVQIYSGTSPAAVSSVDALTYRQIPVVGTGLMNRTPAGWKGTPAGAPDSALWLGLIALALIGGAALIFRPSPMRAKQTVKKRAKKKSRARSG